MDRIFPACPLSRAEFSRATAEDDADIRALLCSVPMAGALKIGFAREPSFFACPAPAGLAEQTLLARRDGRLISVGSWSERKVWMNGTETTVGYLHGLRMAHRTRGSMSVLRQGYRELAECLKHSEAVGWFTSMDAENTRARRVLESRASALPRYTPMAHYLTRVLPMPRRGALTAVEKPESCTELTDFLNREASRYELALTWDAQRWSALARSGFTEQDCCVVRRKGRIVAAAGVWDQSAWKQVVVHGYPAWLRLLRPCISIGAASLGLPGLPREGGRLSLASVFPFAIAESEPSALPELWQQLESLARQRRIDWLALGLDAEDALWKTHRMRSPGISYRTILYAVEGGGFPARWQTPFSGVFRPECATL
jgi:hypothetical protein